MQLKISLCSVVLCAAFNVFATNKKLERVYLLNAVLYMTEPDLTELTMVNKKCAEAVKMARKFGVYTDDAFGGDINDQVQDTLCSLAASKSKPLNREDIETLECRGGLSRCLNIAKRIHDIFPAEIYRIEMYGNDIKRRTLRTLLNTLGSNGFTEVKEIKVHMASGSELFLAIYADKSVSFDHIDIDTLEHKLEGNRSFAYIGDSNVRVIIESIDLNGTDVEAQNKLKEIFKDAVFYNKSIRYEDKLGDEAADSAIKSINVYRNKKHNIAGLISFIQSQYEKRYSPTVYVDHDKFNKLLFEDLQRKKLIEMDENGSISLMKWQGTLDPIGDRRISWKALTNGSYTLDRHHVVDVTGCHSYNSNTSLQSAGSIVVYRKGRYCIVNGEYVPIYAKLHKSFWDQFFNYSGSEIIISDDVKYDDLNIIPRNIDGCITFLGNRDDGEKRRMSHQIARTRDMRNNSKIVEMQGVASHNKIRKKYLYYSQVNIAFPDLAEFKDELDLNQYGLFKNERMEFNEEREIALHHSPDPKPTFRYLIKINEDKYEWTTYEVSAQTNEKEAIHNELTARYPVLQLNGLFGDVYNAPNKRLVIHPNVQKICFTPQAEIGLTFVLGPDINYINKEFWQIGNSYVLNALFGNKTLDYLKRIKDLHGIDISDHPDDLCFWNISKKQNL